MPYSKGYKISIRLTEHDEDIVEWLNMLQANGQSPRTWIQAILIADVAKTPIDAGGVCVAKKPAAKAAPILFGDDSEEDEGVPSSGKTYRIGDCFVFRVTRPSVLGVIRDLQKRNRKVTGYTKTILRRSIRRLPSGPNEPPKDASIEDIFTLAENELERKRKLPRTAPVRRRRPEASRKEGPPAAGKAEGRQTEQSEPVQPQKKRNPLLDYIA